MVVIVIMKKILSKVARRQLEIKVSNACCFLVNLASLVAVESVTKILKIDLRGGIFLV